MTDFKKLADLALPEVSSDLSVWEKKYPPRILPEGARVTRFAPSPTGLPHLGNVFTCNVDLRLSAQSGGVCFLRIEDTDAKRLVNKGVEKIINMLGSFGIHFDEGPALNGGENGAYGPYIQSKRVELYKSCAKFLIEKGFAYPCFCTPEELSDIRTRQKAQKTPAPGYFGEWAKCRDLPIEQVQKNIAEKKPFVIRLRSPGDSAKTDRIFDSVRGELAFPQNIMDIVLLKADKIPTYHFAHVVDDHFMRVTDVIRGDEWLASAPVHVQIFGLMGYKPPKYTHVSPICKLENGNKRKLSKRKDPESGLVFYHEQGYDKDAVLEYMTSIANSNFEDWRRANPSAGLDEFKFNLKNMSVSGALFDFVKLNDICKNFISKLTAQEVYNRYAAWAELYNKEMFELISADVQKWLVIFNIDRETPKPRKDIYNWSMVREYFSYFIDRDFYANIEEGFDLENIGGKADDFKAVCTRYAAVYDPADGRDIWFDKIKLVAKELDYAESKQFKENPNAYRGQLSDVAAMIRIAVTNRTQTPDLFCIMSALGGDEVKKRLNHAVS